MHIIVKVIWTMFILFFFSTVNAEKYDFLEKIIRQYQIDSSEIAYGVINLSKDQIVAMHNEDQLFNPASLVKIITTFISLKELGPNFSWRSDFFYTGEINGDTLRGDIIFQGNGDASFSIEDLEKMIRQIQRRGIKRIEGNLLLDSNYFGSIVKDDSFDNQPMRAYNVPPSAISIQSNTVNFKFYNDKNEIKIEANPSINNLIINSQIKVTDEECSNWREGLEFEKKINVLSFSGKFSQKCEIKEIDLSIIDWPYYFYLIFKQTWINNGGEFAGNYKMLSDSSADKQLLATHSSEPLNNIIRKTNKYSLNFMSRNLMLTVIAEKYAAQPTEEMVNIYINKWLVDNQVENNGLFIDNGAGLSRKTKISVNQYLKILEKIYYDPMMSEMISSFPIAGIDGTLKNRMNTSPLKMNGHFKTGSLSGVNAIAGFFLNKDKEMNAFVFMMNGKKANESQQFQEALIKAVF